MSRSKEAWMSHFEAHVEVEPPPESGEVPVSDPVPASEPPDVDGPLHALDALERGFERAGDPAPAPVPEAVEEAVEATQMTQDAGRDAYPDLSNLTTVKIPHRNLILEGVCSHCAHCGHELTDSVSIQRGIGPVCSRKGYSEDPVEGDEMQAMIDLAEFPELVEFLTEHYKPLGIRGLVNGLVRVASLNRPRGRGQKDGNVKVHSACCDSIESLGHRKLAQLLRETLVIMEVRESEAYPGSYEVWVKRREWTREWSRDLKRATVGSFFCRKAKATVVPIHKPDDPTLFRYSNRTGPGGRRLLNKRALWDLMLKHYGGLVAKVKGEPVKLVEKKA